MKAWLTPCFAAWFTAGLCALALPSLALDMARLDYQLQARQLAPDTWVIEGAVEDFSRANGCNIINTGFITTAEGIWVINTGPSLKYGQQQRAVIERTVNRMSEGTNEHTSPRRAAPPVRAVVSLNLHPDHFLGHGAWADAPTLALPGTRVGMQAEGKAYEDNLFRLCGDWMLGTEAQPAREDLQAGHQRIQGHTLEWRRLSGHTRDDLVLLDHSTGVLFAGGLVFSERVPTMPHAQLPEWMASLRTLRGWIEAGQVRTVVPSHGPVHTGTQGVDQTLDWLQWLDTRLRTSAAQGLDISEVLRLPIPSRFAHWAALQTEYARNVTKLYPAYESQQLPPPPITPVTPGTPR